MSTQIPGLARAGYALKQFQNVVREHLEEAQYALRERRENGASKQLLEKHAPVLSPAQQQVLGELNERGIAIAHVDDLLADGGLWRDLCSEAEAFRQSDHVREERARAAGRQEHKSYLIRKYPYQVRPKLAPSDPWLSLALDPRILDTANAYLQLWSKLHYVDVWLTLPVRTEQKRTASQNWHRDPEDRKLIKVFLYFTDVDERSGPLQYVPGSRRSGGRYSHLWAEKRHFYPPADELEARIPSSEWVTCTGKAGSIVFCDTSGFHRGGYVTGHERLFTTWTYRTPAALEPRRFDVEWSSDSALTGAARFALS